MTHDPASRARKKRFEQARRKARRRLKNGRKRKTIRLERRRETIRLGRKKRRRPKSRFLRILTSPKTTLALGATLAGLVIAPAVAVAGAGRFLATRIAGRAIAKRAVKSVGRGVLGVGKRLIPKTPKGIALSLVGGGILATSPTARRATIQLPKTLVKLGTGIGGRIEGLPPDTKEKAGKFGVGGLVLATLGVGLLGAGAVGVKGLLAKKAVIPKGAIPQPVGIPTSADAQIVSPVESLTPLPEAVSPTGVEPVKKKPTKRRREARRQTISQNVDVRVSQKQSRRIKNYVFVRN